MQGEGCSEQGTQEQNPGEWLNLSLGRSPPVTQDDDNDESAYPYFHVQITWGATALPHT